MMLLLVLVILLGKAALGALTNGGMRLRKAQSSHGFALLRDLQEEGCVAFAGAFSQGSVSAIPFAIQVIKMAQHQLRAHETKIVVSKAE